MSGDDSALTGGRARDEPDEDTPPTKGEDSAADTHENLVGRESNQIFTNRPLLSSAWAAQIVESLQLSASWRDAQESIARIQETLNPHITLPTDFLGSLNTTVATSGVRRLGATLNEFLNSNILSLTHAADFRNPDPPRTAYSPSMVSPRAYFAADEEVIGSMDELNARITQLVAKTPDLPLVWRGARDADWAIHSSLFRRLCLVNGVVTPEHKPKEAQPYPDEDQMVRAEQEILRIARTDWRLDGMSALETFARVQHSGGPTRLLDVTKNPYIAAWFAVEQHEETDDKDARLIAFATQPVSNPNKPSPIDSVIELDAEWGDRIPPWHSWKTPAARQGVDWGTGARRRLWVPPAYNPRIAAQNAAFIIDGVPITSAKTASYFRINKGNYWTRADLLASASIYAKTAKPTRKPRYNAPNLAPTFTFRIASSVKKEIRDFLESRFGYTRSYVYPDITELARYLGTLPLAELG
ncbi:FRG domain-containing protein [Propionibacterium freudenreichii]|uniref:FRG domain-containing protein n=1 Tax=Propionibacterium freudenreichii TaxID=1744 RepID=UPI0005A5CC63|nr:FRG domain-containing protein [Propionibacterium freudenreichii]MDK9331986.1 FRG domain-containing protein [Propionibacterium freudenreichii]CEI30005.1 Protein of unknown function [Propionibacterium freudenreichii]